MKILFAISVLSFCLLLWAAVGITRHIRRSQANKLSHADQPVATQSASPSDAQKSTHRPRYASASSATGRSDRAFTSPEYGDLSYPDAPTRPRGPASSTSNPRRF